MAHSRVHREYLETAMVELERLRNQAESYGEHDRDLTLFAFLLDNAIIEAREQLGSSDVVQIGSARRALKVRLAPQ